MKQITKAQMNTILDNAPQGVDKKQLVDKMIMKGYNVEGIDNEAIRKKNTPEPKGETGVKGFQQGFGKGILSTIKGAGQVGEQVGNFFLPESIEPRPVFSEEALQQGKEEGQVLGTLLNEENLEARGTAEKFGKGTEQIAEFILPASKISNLSKGQSFIRKALSQGGIDSLVQTMQSGQLGKDSAVAGGIGLGVPIVGKYAVKPITNLVSKYGGNVLKSIGGFVSGKGADAVERLFKNPKEGLKGMAGDEIVTLKNLGEKARQGVANIRKNAGREYSEKIAQGNATGKTLDLDALRNQSKEKIADILGTQVDEAGNVAIIDTPLKEAEEKQIQKIINKINTWKDNTPEGINKLATSISKFRRGGTESELFDLIVDDIRRNTRDFVGKQIPEIAQANSIYSQAMDMVDDLENILKTKGAVDSKEGVRKTAEALQLMFGSRKELQREAIDSISSQTGVDILSQEAGRQFKDLAPRSTSAIGGAVSQAISTLIPPQLVGRITAGLGISSQKLNSVLQGLNPNAQQAVSAALIQLIDD